MSQRMVEELAQKRIGRVLKGKWRLERLLGCGGMAAVYLAVHRNGARVAIKMLHATVSASDQLRARFLNEGYIANKVDHPGVVRVLDDDVDEVDGSAFLVMDLVDGRTLSDRGLDRLLDCGELLSVATQVLEVLAAAHAVGVVHRDIKPDNLLVDHDGVIHVLDFGIARLLDDTNLASTATVKTGTAFGTPGFMAPEQAAGRLTAVGPQSDIFSLGATLFALATGDFLHTAESPQERVVLTATQQGRSLSELAPHFPAEFLALVDRSTRLELDQRTASAEQMLLEVRKLTGALQLGHVRLYPYVDPNRDPTDPPRRPLTGEEQVKSSTLSPLNDAAHGFFPARRMRRVLVVALPAVALALLATLLLLRLEAPPRFRSLATPPSAKLRLDSYAPAASASASASVVSRPSASALVAAPSASASSTAPKSVAHPPRPRPSGKRIDIGY